jgi:hypothetical protein
MLILVLVTTVILLAGRTQTWKLGRLTIMFFPYRYVRFRRTRFLSHLGPFTWCLSKEEELGK